VVDNSCSILVAEDNKINQIVGYNAENNPMTNSLQIIRKVLAQLGFQKVEIVDNGRMAFEKVRDKSFDIVLMDIMVIYCIQYCLVLISCNITDARNGRN
jgi:CheY-like chemotaxis protein